jgi:hypothetical protein
MKCLCNTSLTSKVVTGVGLSGGAAWQDCGHLVRFLTAHTKRLQALNVRAQEPQTFQCVYLRIQETMCT